MLDMTADCFTLDRLKTPIGVALLVTDEAGRLCALDWEDFEARMQTLLGRQHKSTAVRLVAGGVPAAMRDRIDAYFTGELRALDAIECRTGGTEFQRSVWAALRNIPPGRTMSYSGLAAGLQCPKAVRAVGLANGANPISVVIPCHRVVGADGSLTGYGGGLERKRWLLSHEGAVAPSSSEARRLL